MHIHYIRTGIYKSSVYGLFIVLILLVCSACAPAVNSQEHEEAKVNNEAHNMEVHNIEAKSINGCVKATAASSITSKQDFTHCIKGTKKTLTSFERRELTNYLYTVSDNELQLLSTNILSKQAPIGTSNKQVIDSILTEVTRLSSNDKGRNSNDDYDDDDDDYDDDGHDHGDHDHG